MKWLIIGLFYVIGTQPSTMIYGNPHNSLEMCLQAMGKITTNIGEQGKAATPPKEWNKIGAVGYQCIREDVYEAIEQQRKNQ